MSEKDKSIELIEKICDAMRSTHEAMKRTNESVKNLEETVKNLSFSRPSQEKSASIFDSADRGYRQEDSTLGVLKTLSLIKSLTGHEGTPDINSLVSQVVSNQISAKLSEIKASEVKPLETKQEERLFDSADSIFSTGKQGEKGDDGRGIDSVKIEDGNLIVTYTDGVEQNAGDLEKLVEEIVKKVSSTLPTKILVNNIGGGDGGGGNSGGGGSSSPITLELTGDVTGQATQIGNKITLNASVAPIDYGDIIITTDQIADFNEEYHRRALLYPLSLFKAPIEPIDGGFQDWGNIHNLTAVNVWGDRVRGMFSSKSNSTYTKSASDGVLPFNNSNNSGNDANNFIEFADNAINGALLFNNSGRDLKLKVSVVAQFLRIAGKDPINISLYFGKGYNDSSGTYFTVVEGSKISFDLKGNGELYQVTNSYLITLVQGECVNLMFKCNSNASASNNDFSVVSCNMIAEQ